MNRFSAFRLFTAQSFLLFVFILFSTMSCAQKSETNRERYMPQLEQAYKDGDWEKIISNVETIINSGEAYDDLALIYAQALEATNNVEKAISILKAELENKEPRTERYFITNELGNAYRLLKDYDNAISYYKQTLELRPLFARAMLGLASVYTELGEISSASDYYLQAASLFIEHGMGDEVLSIGRQMIDIASEDLYSCLVLANGLYMTGDKKECLNLIESLKNTFSSFGSLKENFDELEKLARE